MARYRKKNTLKTVLVFTGVLAAGAVFSKKIIELVSKVPMVGEWVKDQADKENAKP